MKKIKFSDLFFYILMWIFGELIAIAITPVIVYKIILSAIWAYALIELIKIDIDYE